MGWGGGLGWDEGECPVYVRDPGVARCQDTPGGGSKRTKCLRISGKAAFFYFVSFKLLNNTCQDTSYWVI